MAKVTNRELLDNIRQNRLDARAHADVVGTKSMRDILGRAHAQLLEKLEALGLDESDFTVAAYEAILAQIEDVTANLVDDMGDQILDDADDAAELGAGDTLDVLSDAEDSFRGLGEYAGLPIDESMAFDQAVRGSHASILRRLGGDEQDPGVLQRYGMNTIGEFEDIMKVGLLAGSSQEEMADDLIDASPFLQGNPRFWGERIARTEIMGAYNHASWESIRSVEDQVGEDMLKIIVEIDDDRTGWDSYAVHGQVRRTDEPFEWVTYRGDAEFYMYPPNRPNDRATVVSWNPAWGPIPDEMQPFDDDMYISAWYEQTGKKKPKSPPRRPPMTTLSDDEMAKLWT